MRKAALACAATIAIVAAFAGPAQGAAYQAAMQISRGSGAGALVTGYGNKVAISKFGGWGRSLFASYAGPGRTTPRGIFGRLGRFGSVRLRFEPDGKPTRTSRPKSCTGGPRVLVTWKGKFSGKIRFAPDASLPAFTRSDSFEGMVQSVSHWHCRGEERPPKFNPDAGGVNVFASNCDGRGFQATVEVEPPSPSLGEFRSSPAHFSASWTKSVGIAKVTYSVSSEGGPDAAVFADDLSEGTIKPPPPFHGEARILKQGNGWEWSGSLTARFPGRTVSLTGPGFQPHVETFEPSPGTIYGFIYTRRC